MTLLIIWGTVGVLLFSILSYLIGRKTSTDTYEIGNLFFASAMLSIFWPIVLAILIVAGPLHLPYKLGTINRKKAEENAQMWETLKK